MKSKNTPIPFTCRQRLRAPVRRLRGLHVAMLAGALSLAASGPLAAKTWRAAVVDGDWDDTASWVGGTVPGDSGNVADNADFNYNGTYPAVTVNLNIPDATATLLRVGLGQSVEFNIGTGGGLTLGSISRVGDTAVAYGSGPGILTVNGPATGSGTLNFRELFVQNGSSAIFSGSNLKVAATSNITLGNIGNDNILTVTGGAELAAAGIGFGHASNGLGTKGNQVKVEADSTLKLTSGGATIGSAANHRSNSLTVSGLNAVLEVQAGALNIGNGTATNFGGNAVEISLGGLVRTGSATQINGYAFNGGDHDGANRLVIAAGGSFTSSSTITNHGLLQLAEGGVLEGKTIAGDATALTVAVEDGARFEAAGSGLGSTVTTHVASGGRFAVGLEGATTASQLTLDSGLQFSAGSALELSLFEDGSMDAIHFLNNASLTGEVNLVLDQSAPVAGSWVVFTGDTSRINALFHLDALNPAIWDTSRFNEDGGWQLAVIPEPSLVALLTAAGLCLAGDRLRRRRRVSGNAA